MSLPVRRIRAHLFTRLRPECCRRSRSPFLDLVRCKHEHSNDYKRRTEQLDHSAQRSQWYPSITEVATGSERPTIAQYNEAYKTIKGGETRDEETTIAGRIKSVRAAGSKLIFVTVEQDQHDVQIVLRQAKSAGSLASEDLSSFTQIARRGDNYIFSGHPHRTARGQLSLLATARPSLTSPSLHQVPETLHDPDIISHQRHIRMLVDPDTHRVIKLRDTVEWTISTFLRERGFSKVTTPVLNCNAGGAIARPFKTHASEFQDKTLHLRIAPELWLKRLILGGMDRVYEIGPVFRNEGIDATHNPEFSTCEFYAAYASLDKLIMWTEQMMTELSSATGAAIQISTPFAQLEFLPTIERKMGQSLPDLDAEDADQRLTEILMDRGIQVPAHPSLPRLLDALATHYIEPDCSDPTFITNHPAALSPLAKHKSCPTTGQRISARAELFIHGKEVANMYEEQNSPFEQEKAFLQQLKYRAIDGEDDGSDTIDRAYLQALEWGLPPTGGWGCGIDRLVMLFAGKNKIGDVLPFGTLRSVVGSDS